MGKLRERHPYTRDPEIFPPIKPELAQAVGYVAIHWSFVEEQLATAIRFLLRLPPAVEIAMLAEVPTLTRVTMLRALMEVSGEVELSEEWDDLSDEFNELRAKRNDIVHGVWQVVEPSHYLKRAKAKSKLKFEYGPVDTGTVEKLSNEILEFSDKLVSLTSGIIFSNADKKLRDHYLKLPTGARQLPALARLGLAQPPGQKKIRQKRPSSAQRRAGKGGASGSGP
jgi:hypothetical protein